MIEALHIAQRVTLGAFSLDVTLDLPGRGVSAIFGPSGCGKSTLLRALAGLEANTQGRVHVAGQCWQEAQQRLPAHRRNVGMVFQHAALLPHLSVEENLRYGWKRAKVGHDVLARWVAQLDLPPLLARKPASLSGGERQRVALARALVCAPRLLLLDEPLSALDVQRRTEILPYLEAIRSAAEIPILYVTHAVDEVARLADHLVLLEAGRVLAEGPALELLNRHDLPLALRDDAGVVLEAHAQSRDAHGLMTLHTQAGTLYAHGPEHSQGAALRVRILARDVSLALRRHDDTSLLNVLPATVMALDDIHGGQVQVRLEAQGCPLLARISHRSLERLQLQPGMQLWAQIKAVALLV